MDFLFLFLFYLACLLLSGVLMYMGSRTQYLNGLIRRGTQVKGILEDPWTWSSTGLNSHP